MARYQLAVLGLVFAFLFTARLPMVLAKTCVNDNAKWTNINRFLCGAYLDWDYKVDTPPKKSLSWFYWTEEHLKEALEADGVPDWENYKDRIVAQSIKGDLFI